jgi:hypothetical protein
MKLKLSEEILLIIIGGKNAELTGINSNFKYFTPKG